MGVGSIQREIPMMAHVRRPTMAPEALVKACSNRLDAIILCIQLSRLSQGEVAKRLGLDKGHLTRILQGLAYFPDQKSVELMSVCGNYAPMQYEAMATGFELYEDVRAKKKAELKAALAELEQEELAA
jgi:transcriptional regulator with XRE-family HTH domain